MSAPSSASIIDNNEEEQERCDFSFSYLCINECSDQNKNVSTQDVRNNSSQSNADDTQVGLFIEKRMLRRRSSSLLYPKEVPEVEELVQKGKRISCLFKKRRDSGGNPIDIQLALQESSATLESLLSSSFINDDEAPGVVDMNSPPRLESSRRISNPVAEPTLMRLESERFDDEAPGAVVSVPPRLDNSFCYRSKAA